MGRWPMVFRVAKEGRGGCQPFCPQLLVYNPKTGLTDENLKDLSERLALMR